jgi:hypothetical protein
MLLADGSVDADALEDFKTGAVDKPAADADVLS